MGGQRDLHATGDTHYIPPPPTIYTTLAGYGIAERDGERRESGRRACLRYGAERDLYAILCGPGRRACLRIGTACVLRIGTTSDTVRARMASERSGRRAIRYGAGLVCDTVRARTASERSGRRAIRCGYDRRVRTVRFGTTCERDGAGAAGIAGRVHGFGATGGDSDLYGRLRVRLEA